MLQNWKAMFLIYYAANAAPSFRRKAFYETGILWNPKAVSEIEGESKRRGKKPRDEKGFFLLIYYQVV